MNFSGLDLSLMSKINALLEIPTPKIKTEPKTQIREHEIISE